MANVMQRIASLSSTTTADNAAATVTIADTAAGGQSHYVTSISASFSAAIAGKLMTLKDGATVVGNYHVHNQRDIVFASPIEIRGAAEVSLAASGAGGTIGAVTVSYYTR